MPTLRGCAILLTAVLTAHGAYCGNPAQVTVAQLEQFLGEQAATHASDEATAQKLRSVELSEQLTQLRLERWKRQYGIGEETADQLEVLADLSAFFDPPTSEILEKRAPSAAEQQAMLAAAASFVNGTLQRLPDFLAKRTTRSFEDVPVFTADGSFQSGMHPMGRSVRQVAFRNGLEFATNEDRANGGAPSQAGWETGLSSAGEFGPILATVMADAAHGSIRWIRWEQAASGTTAVFQYDVPKPAAHYEIRFCCAWSSTKESFAAYRGTPAYHGTITMDAASGAILDLTLEAEFDDLEQPPQFGLLVRYGTVEIEGDGLMCPLRSAVIVRSTEFARKRVWERVHVNDMTFTGYRRFGSTARVVPGAQAQ
jgi:hypothetical protein